MEVLFWLAFIILDFCIAKVTQRSRLISIIMMITTVIIIIYTRARAPVVSFMVWVKFIRSTS